MPANKYTITILATILISIALFLLSYLLTGTDIYFDNFFNILWVIWFLIPIPFMIGTIASIIWVISIMRKKQNDSLKFALFICFIMLTVLIILLPLQWNLLFEPYYD